MLSGGIENVETINWQLAVCLLVAWMAVFLCSFKGIKTSGKVEQWFLTPRSFRPI